MPRLKKRADGRYKVKYHGHQFYGATEKEALAARDAFIAMEAQGLTPVRTAVLIREYAPLWLSLYKRSVTENAYNDYARQLDKLITVLGDRSFDSITVDDVVAFWRIFDGYSASTIHRARMIYKSLFNAAVENDYCRKNPFLSALASPPDGPTGSHRPITPEERQLILTSSHFFAPAVMTMLYAGLRRGEALAVDLDRDYDPRAKQLTVCQAVRFCGARPVLADPKTEAGFRTIDVPDILAACLQDRHGLLAPSRAGVLMSESAFRSAWNSFVTDCSCRLNGYSQRCWYGRRAADLRILASGGQLPPWREFTVRCHDLRVSYCTMLRDAGVDIKQAMVWMGHADESMILRIYDQPGDARRSACISRLNTYLQPLGVQNGVQNPSAV